MKDLRPVAQPAADLDRPGIEVARKLDLAVGGQAVIEGVMMRSPTAIATAVRNPEGRIVIRKKPFHSIVARHRWLSVPVFRGGVHLIETMGLGIDALMFSADQAVSEERIKDKKSSLKDQVWMWGTIGIAFLLSLGLFFYLPLMLTHWLGVEGSIWFNVVDGVIRVALFVLYLWAISLMKDMARVFEYHGAEHKSIHAFENGRSLDADGARPFTTLHPRCGTSFLFFVMIISILVFVFLGKPETIGERLLRLAFVPVIGGLAYEAIKLSGKYCNAWWLKPAIQPGLWLQKITTSQPDDSQLEVAMAALRAVLTPEAEGFKTRIYYELPEGESEAAAPTGSGGGQV
ncbi:MAG TPA: DUF1385 domain-containing protein [Candidatus Krumholzibacteria bacterium]|nr:DUF1385 domain-containing protein [Candidatus Krumholzibacteria bacterium]HPD71950.1 DUF1385 domain-containing protein [Candidatus Krumholzibacteria bacterium]HRY41117.1 DUF1385 domain-containing protein [Candidatus Krumholzibacteria bacterium]